MFLGGEPDDFVPDFLELYITYYGLPGEFKQVSLKEVFDEDFDPAWWADCIVMIGPYAVGLMDSYYVPVSHELMHGVEIHANVVQMLLEGDFIEYAPWAVNLSILLCTLAIAIALAYFIGIRLMLAAYAVVSVFYYFLAQHLFGQGIIVTLFYPAFAIVLIYIYQLVYGYVLEVFEKQKVKAAFKKYVDPKLVDKLVDSGEANSDEIGVKKDIAVLFVDVCGFTSMTEALSDEPETVVEILNDYLELAASAVFENGGSVDKFIGDAIMALFNGFVPLEDYAYKAVKTAWDIVRGAEQLNVKIKEKYGLDAAFGAGIDCGSAIVGNLGPSFRKDYTAIGDMVNTSARLESIAGPSEILISSRAYDIVKDRVEAVSIGEVPLKGKSAKMEVFSVKNVL
jgi:adenylate cyclase